ncbi:hypothetical protein V2W30_13760 [Streptomyces sp. Q6]|uniref:Uncharacterized protein n=1 Tax=Streptomyces citrinus TaxID=3118173 RepID=A0ACD5AAQ5_9ACTN
MPNGMRTLYCITCKGDHPHRPLDADERTRLRKGIGRKYVDDVWVCERHRGDGGPCGTLRTGLNKNPFDGPKKLPDY